METGISKEELLFDISCMEQIVKDNYIYYINLEDQERIWKIRDDGEDNQSLNSETASELIEIADGKWLHYLDEYGDERKVTLRGKYDREVE